MDTRTWLVIPCFNEARVIGQTVSNASKFFSNIVVVDDASSDDSGAVAAAAKARVLSHPFNLGQGAALATGIRFALAQGAEFVATFDADGQHCPEDVVSMVAALQEHGVDAVIGSRFAGSAPGMPASRRLTLKAAVLFTRATTGLKVTDAHNGLRVLSAKLAQSIKIRQDRMAHASEILSEFARLDARWIEHPVTITYSDYSIAKGQRMSASFRILSDLFASGLQR